MIDIQDLNKYYRVGKSWFHVLKDVSLHVGRGEMVAVTGRSGSGKTTLLNIIGTVDSYDDGTYTYCVQEVRDLSDRKKAALRAKSIGFVNQDYMLLEHRTAAENVELPLYFGKVGRTEIRRRAVRALSELGILPLAQKKVCDLSGGEKQRVAIARALVIGPELILADEPTGALDENTGNDIMQILRKLNAEQGITMIIVTHDSDVAAFCGRTVRLNDGRIAE